MSTKTKVGFGALVIVFVVLLLTEGVLIPKQLQPDVLPVRFVGYRDGTDLTAVFEIANRAGSPVVVWEAAELIIHRGTSQEEQQIVIPRTTIAEEESAVVVVDAPRDCAWQVKFRAARFGPSERRRYEAAKPLTGTVVYSDIVPEYRSKP